MHKQETLIKKPTYKLSGNNSLLTFSDGKVFNVNIENAFINFLDDLQSNDLSDLRIHILSIHDELTEHLPDDYCHGMYKKMSKQLQANAAFFSALFEEVKGGSHG